MYKLKFRHNCNIAPWNIPVSARLSDLRRYISEGNKVVLLLYGSPDTSTFRYRGYNMAQASRNTDQWRIVYFFESELSFLDPYLKEVKAVTVVRMGWTLALDTFIHKIKRIGIPLLFDTDDLVFDLDYLPMIANTLNVDLNLPVNSDYWFSYISRIGLTASKADGFITTNDFLGSRLHDKFGKPYRVIRNFLNDEQLRVSSFILKEKAAARNRKPFVIGYFSGTPSHSNDFMSIYKELLQLMLEYKAINLNVVGFMEFPPEMQPLIKSGRIHFYNLVDFLTLQSMIAQTDVNIAPLVENTFTNCKSELKFFEAAIVNTITCATPSFAFRESISNSKDGFLCNQGDWYQVIKNIYLENVDCARIQRAAKDNALKYFAGQKISDSIADCYNFFSA